MRLFHKLRIIITAFFALMLAFCGWVAYLGTSSDKIHLDYELSGTTRFAVPFNPNYYVENEKTPQGDVIVHNKIDNKLLTEKINGIENDVASYCKSHGILFYDNKDELITSIQTNSLSTNNRWYPSWNDTTNQNFSPIYWPWALIFCVDTGAQKVQGIDTNNFSYCTSDPFSCKKDANNDIKSKLLNDDVIKHIHDILVNDIQNLYNLQTNDPAVYSFFDWSIPFNSTNWLTAQDFIKDANNTPFLYQVNLNSTQILKELGIVALNFVVILIFLSLYVFVRFGWGTAIALISTYITYFILSNLLLTASGLFISVGSWVVSLIGVVLFLSFVLTFLTQYRAYYLKWKNGTQFVKYSDVEKDIDTVWKKIKNVLFLQSGFALITIFGLIIVHIIDKTALSYQWKYILNVELFALINLVLVWLCFGLFLFLLISFQKFFINRQIKYILQATNWKDKDENEEEIFLHINDLKMNEDKEVNEIENPFLRPREEE